jgi:hypothetical protein
MIKGRDILIIALFLLAPTLQCHYSCSTCTDAFYSSCTTCPNSQALVKAEGFSSTLIGVCSNINISNANLFGLFLLVILISSCAIFPKEEVIHFFVLMQSIGLLYLVEVLWSA